MKTKPIIFIIIALVLIFGFFYLFKPKSSEVLENTKVLETTKVFDLKVNARKLVSGPSTLEVREGDNVTINITVDEPEELHLHGYDKNVDLEKNVQGEITFVANLTGRFPFELENSKIELGNLEVQPK